MSNRNVELTRRIFNEVWNQKKLGLIDELVSPDYIHHDSGTATVQTDIEGYKQFVRLFQNAFPDIRFTIQDEISEGDKVVIRWTVTGTHRGDLPDLPASDRAISLSGISIARLRNGKGIESWNNWDGLGMMKQLGAISAEARERAA
jgi:steroid delta-isomerase-like uncharacterized protein